MRLRERDRQDIYVSNSDGYGEYHAPMKFKGTVSGVNSFVRDEKSIILDEFDEMVTFLLEEVKGHGISKTSIFWIRKKPDVDKGYSDYTHGIKGIVTSPDSQFVFIVLKGTEGYNPLQ